MVNLDKWEEVKFEDIKEGDQIRRVVTDNGDFAMESSGIAKRKSTSYWDVRWLTETGWILAKSKLNSTTAKETLYRRKPKPFKFPENVGAIIEGEPRHTSGFNRRYVRTAGMWRNLATGDTALEDALQSNFHNWVVHFEGIAEA